MSAPGKGLEAYLDALHELDAKSGRSAIIHVPTPGTITGRTAGAGRSFRAGGKVWPDFAGGLRVQLVEGGASVPVLVAGEAKECGEAIRFPWGRVKPHQMERLRWTAAAGGIAWVYVRPPRGGDVLIPVGPDGPPGAGRRELAGSCSWAEAEAESWIVPPGRSWLDAAIGPSGLLRWRAYLEAGWRGVALRP